MGRASQYIDGKLGTKKREQTTMLTPTPKRVEPSKAGTPGRATAFLTSKGVELPKVETTAGLKPISRMPSASGAVTSTPARDVAVRQAFKARPVEVPKAEPAKAYTPNYASRLSGGGMNLAAEQVVPVMEKRADGGRRQNAGAATLGYSTLGMGPNFVETANQAIHNAWSDLHNKDYQDAKKDYKDVKSYSQGRLRAEMGVTTDKHEAKQQEFERLYAKADSLRDKTPVNQNRTGQKLMAKARESHEIATEGMNWFEKLLADTAISMYQNSPGIVLSAVTKNPTIGLLFMGSQAGSQKMAELNSRGIAPNEALVRGAASGAIEFATEKLPLENLLKIATGKAGQNFLKNVAKQAGMESVEEGIAYVGDALVDAVANDPEAQFSLSDLALAMAAGGLSGGFMSLGGTMVGGTSRKVADPVTEAMSNSDDPANRTAAEVQKANPDTVVVTQEAEAMIAEGVKPAQAVEATRNVAAVTEGATGITSKQIEAILKDPKAAALFEQKSGIKLSASKAEARNQIKAYHAQIAALKDSEQIVAEPTISETLTEQVIAPEMQEQVITEAETYEPYVQVGEAEAQVNAPLEAVRQKLTEMVAPEKAEALLREYDADVQKLGRAPRFAPFTDQNRNRAVEAFAENNDAVLRELGLSGIEVYYEPSRVDPDTGRRIKERGKFDRNRNVIQLNGATLQGQDAAAAIVSHELVHKAATKDTAIADRIISTYQASKGLTLDARYKEYALNYSGFIEGVDGAALKRMTPAEVSELLTAEQKAYLNEEIAADLMMQALGSKKQMEQFAKTGGRGVLEQVRGIIDRILSALGSGNAKLRVAYNNMLRDLDSVLKSTEAAEQGKVAGEPRYSFAGEKAAGANLSWRDGAKEAVELGHSKEGAFVDFGWYQGADGKWRFEIDDSKATLNETGNTLGERLNHPELFSQYPSLKSVGYIEGTLSDGANGHFDQNENEIVVNESLAQEQKLSTTLHEIQHAIQNIEGFAGGASPRFYDQVGKERVKGNKYQELAKRKEELLESVPDDFMDTIVLLARKEGTDEYFPLYKKASEKYGDTLRKYFDIDVQQDMILNDKTDFSPLKLYYNTAGEIEARDVQQRRELGEDERAETLPDTGDNRDIVFAEDYKADNTRYSIESDLKASEQKVEKLEAKNEALKAEMKPIGGVRVDNNKAVRVTKDVLKRYKSGYDATDMQARIQDYYEAMLEDRYDWGEYDQLAYNIASDIVRESNTSAFVDLEGEIQALAQELTDRYADTLTDRQTKADKIEQKIRAEHEALPFDKWLSDRLANNKASLVRDIIEQRSPSMFNSVDGKPVYLTTKEARALTAMLATLQTDLVGMQEEVKAVKVEKAKKVERVRKEAKVEANWTAAENKKRTDWLVAEAKHEGEVKVESQKELLEARMEKIHAENEAKIEKIEARDAKRLAKVNKKLEEQKRKRRLSSVKGKDAAKTMRNYQSEKNKQKAVEDAGERFIANLTKTEADKTFDQKLSAAKSKVRDGWDTARHLLENRLQEFDNFSSWESVPMTSALTKRAQNMPAVSANILLNEYMSPNGDIGGASLSDVVHIKNSKGKVDVEAQDIYNEYLYTMHDIDRMSFVERAKEKVVAFETAHPEIAALDSEGLADIYSKVIPSEESIEKARQTKAENNTGKQKNQTKELTPSAKEKLEAKNQQAALGRAENRRLKALAGEYTKLLKELNATEDKPVLAWGKKGDPDYREAMTAEEARAHAAALREANPWLVERSEALYAWWDKFMRDWAVGVQLTEAEYQQMKTDYPHYVPTFRAKETLSTAGGNASGARVSTSSVFKKAKGSLKDLNRPDDNFRAYVQKICNQRAMSDLCTWMMDQSYSDPDVFGDRLLVADPTGNADANVFSDLEGRANAGDDMLSVDKESGLYKLTTWRDGEKIEAYISKKLYRSFQSLTNSNRHEGLELFTKIGRGITTPHKMAITGYSPSFFVRNPIMDFPTAVVNSIAGTQFPMFYAKAINDIRTNAEDWRRFQAMGGVHSGFYSQEKGFTDNSRLAAKKGPLRGISKANEIAEGVTRYAEYLANIDKYGDTPEGRALGIKNAAEVTVDFSRVGELFRVVNAWVPYSNPAVQGISRQLRLVFGGQQKSIQQRAANLGIVLTRATMVSLLPEIILISLYKALGEEEEWKKLSPWDRGSNYSIPRYWFTRDPADKGLFIKIPKAREWARWVGTPFMMMVDGMYGKEDPFYGYFEQVLEPSVSPPVTPFIVNQINEIRRNEKFTGAAIVPSQYEDVTPREHWDENTSKFAIELGDMFNWSPMQIDYLAHSMFGNWGRFLSQMTGNPGLDANDSTWAEGMLYNFNNNFSRRFVADNVYSNATTSKFYDTYTQAKADWREDKLRGDDPENSIASQTKNVMDTYYKSMSDISREIRELAKVPMPKKERDEKQRALRQSMNVIAAEAMDFYNDIQTGKSKNPKLELQHKSLGVSAPVSKELTALKDVEGYNFQPVKSQKSISDPNKKGYEFKLTDAQRLAYDAAYIKLYNATMETAIRRPSYLKADDKGKAEKLEAARDGVGSNESVGDKARRQFIAELKKQGIKSTKK